MFHPVFLGVVGGALVARMVMRIRHGRGCAGGSRMAFGGRRWRRGRVDGRAAAGVAPIELSTVIGALELNARQKQELDEVLQTLRQSLGVERIEAWPGLSRALRLVGGATFDRAELAAHEQLSDEAIDGLEHLHNILTPEQRAQLTRVAA
jgi:hypothetical protein